MAHRIPKSSAKFKDIQKYSKMFNRENFAQLMVNQFLTRVFLIPVALKKRFSIPFKANVYQAASVTPFSGNGDALFSARMHGA
jgi:hypothetical protein